MLVCSILRAARPLRAHLRGEQEETVVKGGSGKLDTPPPGETNLLEGLEKDYGSNL